MSDYGWFEYGGVRFTRKVPQSKIAAYIASLSDDRKSDVEQVVVALEAAGLLAMEKAPAAESVMDVQNKQYGMLESMSPTLSDDAALATPNAQMAAYEERLEPSAAAETRLAIRNADCAVRTP